MRTGGVVLLSALATAGALVVAAGPAGATNVTDETTFRAAWGNAAETQIDLDNDIVLVGGMGCLGEAVRTSAMPLTVNGHGFSITQQCPDSAVLQQLGTGALTFQNVTITGGNSASPTTTSGVATPADVTLINSTITGNATFFGAGGISAGGNVTATNSTISGNTTAKAGGGVSAGGTLMVSGSTISGNSAGGVGGFAGGGLHATGAATITNSSVIDNDATGAGGGVFSSAGVTVTNSTFTLNTASAGAAVSGVTVALTNSTVSGNTGSGTMGAVQGTGSVSLVYSTVVSNTSGTTANITAPTRTSFGSVVALPLGGGTNCSVGTTTSNGFNFSDDASCGFTNTAGGDRQSAGNPGLGPLADNGGPTQTHMPMRPGPLPDAIPAANCQDFGASGVTSDQRGVSRPQGPGCDIGSVEAPPPPPAAPKVCAKKTQSLGGFSPAGTESVLAIAPVGLQALLRRRRREKAGAKDRRAQLRAAITWVMIGGVGIAVVVACQPIKKC